MMTGARWILAALAILLFPAGCGEKPKTKADDTFHKPVVEKLAKAKLKVGDWKLVAKPETYGASACREGLVSELVVLLCKYESPEKAAAAAAAEKRLAFVGRAVSGAERVDGRLVLVVSDRDKKDLRGTTIQAIIQAFKTEKPF